MRTSSTLPSLTLAELGIDDEGSFRHVGLYAKLKSSLEQAGSQFAVCEGGLGRAQLLNLGFWRPGEWVEVLPEAFISADQVMHNAWHVLVGKWLGDSASSGPGLLLAESVASAFDVYLVGRLIGHSPDSDFLCSQVPAMREAAEEAGQSAPEFALLLEQFSRKPEESFEQFRQLLFNLSLALVGAADVVQADGIVREMCHAHPLGSLVHHYELPTWVLQARAAGGDLKQHPQVEAMDGALRQAVDAVQWLEENVVPDPNVVSEPGR
jgi:hypothetical protein